MRKALQISALRFALSWVMLAMLAFLTACGGGSGSNPAPSPGQTLPPTPANVLTITVDSGPTSAEVNRPFVSVTVCEPGSSTSCTTVPHVLLDTGSVGLRLLASALPESLKLPRATSSTGQALLNCVQFVDKSYAWGAVASADLKLGGKTAFNLPLQLIADPSVASLGHACASGTAITSIAELGANGILGLGLGNQDCGSGCATRASNGVYFTCSDTTCTAVQGVAVATTAQIKHPVPLFSSDNNGLLLDLPAVANSGAASVSGSLIFGIGTQDNNQPGTAVALPTNNFGYVSTTYATQTLRTSYIDSGSNGLYFSAPGIPVCTKSGYTDFFCPAAQTRESAIISGTNGANATVNFAIDNTVNLFATIGNKAALPTLGGPSGDNTTFDWGLPFFYGRRVFIGIAGQGSMLGTGPFYAY